MTYVMRRRKIVVFSLNFLTERFFSKPYRKRINSENIYHRYVLAVVQFETRR